MKIERLCCHRKLIKIHEKYVVSIVETTLINLIAVFGCTEDLLIAEHTPLFPNPWVGHHVEGEV